MNTTTDFTVECTRITLETDILFSLESSVPVNTHVELGIQINMYRESTRVTSVDLSRTPLLSTEKLN